jgi:hypothetical protein
MRSVEFKLSSSSRAVCRWRYWRFSCSALVLALTAGCGGGGGGSDSSVAAGSAALSWEKPTTNDDGSPMTNLAGYQIYYSQRTPVTTDNSQSASVLNPNKTSYVVADLTPGTYYFTVTAVNLQGGESRMSNEAVKTIF